MTETEIANRISTARTVERIRLGWILREISVLATGPEPLPLDSLLRLLADHVQYGDDEQGALPLVCPHCPGVGPDTYSPGPVLLPGEASVPCPACGRDLRADDR